MKRNIILFTLLISFVYSAYGQLNDTIPTDALKKYLKTFENGNFDNLLKIKELAQFDTLRIIPVNDNSCIMYYSIYWGSKTVINVYLKQLNFIIKCDKKTWQSAFLYRRERIDKIEIYRFGERPANY